MKVREPTSRCKDCRFFQFIDLPNFYGECHRYPPAWKNNNGTDWPDVDETTWCGEFARVE